jgi:hypothetical protein
MSAVPTTPRATTGRRTSAAIALLFSAALLAATGAAAATCPTCDDGNPCTDDLCDVNQICVHAANSAACNDGIACTTGDVCNAGSCVGGAPAAGCTACQAEAVIAPEGGTFTGTTSGASSLTGTCSSTAGSPERVYRWTPARSGPAVIETCGTGTGFDTVLYLRTGSCAAGQTIGCNDDIAGCAIASGASLGSRLTPTVTAGRRTGSSSTATRARAARTRYGFSRRRYAATASARAPSSATARTRPAASPASARPPAPASRRRAGYPTCSRRSPTCPSSAMQSCRRAMSPKGARRRRPASTSSVSASGRGTGHGRLRAG